MDEFKRKVVRCVKTEEEKSSVRGRTFTWNKKTIRTVTAECGHVRILRGFTAKTPKHFSPCKDCAAGVPAVPVDGPLGFIDLTSNDVKDPVAAALFRRHQG